MPNNNRSAELDAIEAKHTHRRGNLLTLDVASALDEYLEALEGMTPAERAEALLS